MVELSKDFYTEEVEDLDETSEDNHISSLMDLSDIRPAEIEIEDEIRMGYLRMKYKKF